MEYAQQYPRYNFDILLDKQPLIESNMAGFIDIVKNTFLTDGSRDIKFNPYVTQDIIDIPLIDNQEHLCVFATIISILKSACPIPVTGNDYTVVDYAAVEINNNKHSNAKSIIIATFPTLDKIVDWHMKNNTHDQFLNLFVLVPVYDELLDEDEFFVLKYFAPNENTRMFAFDEIRNTETNKLEKIAIAASPHLPLRAKRVRKSVIAMSQDDLFIDDRYNKAV